MFSKSGEPPADAGNAASCRRSRSLTVRLAFMTALSSGIILTLISAQMYFMLARNLENQNTAYLMDEVETLAQMARFPEFKKLLTMEMHIDPVGEQYMAYFVRLLGSGGETISETPGMAKRLPHTLFPPPSMSGKSSPAVTAGGGDGASYIVTSLVLDRGELKNSTLEVGLDVTNVEKVLADYRVRLACALVIGFIFCAGAGLVIALRGTRPIRELTERARKITVANLDDRLQGANWPHEVTLLADALNGMLDRLNDFFSRMNNSAANLSHKLRTPITIIRGEGEIALSRERTAEELREVIASSLEECERLSHLVDNMIFIVQAEANKLQHVLIKIKARTEIDKVLDFYTPLAEEKGVTITCKGNAFLATDPTLFRQVVANLMANALTFTPPGGTIDVHIWQDDIGHALLLMTDTGCGIAAEELPRIFDWYYRVYSTRFLAPHGSGLGLSLVKTIMDLHNGTIEAQSRPGQGTAITLTFPPPAG